MRWAPYGTPTGSLCVSILSHRQGQIKGSPCRETGIDAVLRKTRPDLAHVWAGFGGDAGLTSGCVVS